MEEEFYPVMNPNYRDRHNRRIQLYTIFDTETNKPSRTHNMSLDEALEVLNEEFEFEDGRQYKIKTLVGQDWKERGVVFTYRDGMNLYDVMYNEDAERDLYNNYEALTNDDIRIFGIAVEDHTRPEQ